MTAFGLDLLLRVTRQSLSARPCPQCGEAMTEAEIAVREQAPEGVLLEVGCPHCAHRIQLRIAPGADEGAAQVS